MKVSRQVRIKLALLVGDLLLLTLCLGAAIYLRLQDVSLLYEEYITPWLLCLMIYPLSFYLTRSYEVQPEASSAENLRRPLLGLLFAATATSFLFYFAPDIRFGRGIFAIANFLFFFMVIAWRLGTFLRLRRGTLPILAMGNPAEVEIARQLIGEFSPRWFLPGALGST